MYSSTYIVNAVSLTCSTFTLSKVIVMRITLHDNYMKDLSMKGKIAPRIKAEPITIEEEEKLWKYGVLDDGTLTKLC